MTDAAGTVAFHTIFPGWYPGRTTPVHHKVILHDNTVPASQIFFDETVATAISEHHQAYAARGSARNVLNADDRIAADAGTGTAARVRRSEPDGARKAALVGGINPEGRSAGLLEWLWRQG